MLYESDYSLKTNANKRHLLPFLTHQFHEKMHLSNYQCTDESIPFKHYYLNNGLENSTDVFNSYSFAHLCENSNTIGSQYRGGYQWARIEQVEEFNGHHELSGFPYRKMENEQEMRGNVAPSVFKNRLNSVSDNYLQSEAMSCNNLKSNDSNVPQANNGLHECILESERQQNINNILYGNKKHGEYFKLSEKYRISNL